MSFMSSKHVSPRHESFNVQHARLKRQHNRRHHLYPIIGSTLAAAGALTWGIKTAETNMANLAPKPIETMMKIPRSGVPVMQGLTIRAIESPINFRSSCDTAPDKDAGSSVTYNNRVFTLQPGSDLVAKAGFIMPPSADNVAPYKNHTWVAVAIGANTNVVCFDATETYLDGNHAISDGVEVGIDPVDTNANVVVGTDNNFHINTGSGYSTLEDSQILTPAR